ncbi:N-acetylglucosamine kinase [Saccharothrix yanglingensis]|uniref:ATPase n=1 Tax=Saccharothrix yanglingensis TaxID=659496 RepID=A0ABU0WUB2_9PSEU|nr:BadF/BadG/BcrA/BcrD ATPase family protein [Saccharothrix yanglingensis]MDQ2583426.1 ATPase [Saccharothrix yanglingensis]
MGFVVGLDAGGTSTRALVLDLDGTRLGAGVAGGANPNSHPPEVAAAHVGQALTAALDGLDAGKVEAGVLGMAGSSKLTEPAVAALFEAAWAGAGLRCPMRVVTDCEAAFASGSSSPDGTVLVAGTGSIAARIAGHRLVSTTGGYGWLLGDEGSAFWLGREAVRAALAALERDDLDAFTAAVLRRASVPGGAPRDRWRRLITAANASAPVELARFAPLVTEHAATSPVASEVVDGAVRSLVDLAAATRLPADGTPIVLMGGLVHAAPLGERLKRELAARCAAPVLVATEGAAGAAWLAAVEVVGEGAPRPA